jgi:hypothetical protein
MDNTIVMGVKRRTVVVYGYFQNTNQITYNLSIPVYVHDIVLKSISILDKTNKVWQSLDDGIFLIQTDLLPDPIMSHYSLSDLTRYNGDPEIYYMGMNVYPNVTFDYNQPSIDGTFNLSLTDINGNQPMKTGEFDIKIAITFEFITKTH